MLPDQVPVPAVAEDERLLVKPQPYPGFFRVVARYGYNDRIDQARHLLVLWFKYILRPCMCSPREQPVLAWATPACEHSICASA